MEGTVLVVAYHGEIDRKLQMFTEGTFAVAGMVADLLISSANNDDLIKTITIHPKVEYDDFQSGKV